MALVPFQGQTVQQPVTRSILARYFKKHAVAVAGQKAKVTDIRTVTSCFRMSGAPRCASCSVIARSKRVAKFRHLGDAPPGRRQRSHG